LHASSLTATNTTVYSYFHQPDSGSLCHMVTPKSTQEFAKPMYQDYPLCLKKQQVVSTLVYLW